MTQLANATCSDSQGREESVKASEPQCPLGYNHRATTGRNAMHDTLIRRHESASVRREPVVLRGVSGRKR